MFYYSHRLPICHVSLILIHQILLRIYFNKMSRTWLNNLLFFLDTDERAKCNSNCRIDLIWEKKRKSQMYGNVCDNIHISCVYIPNLSYPSGSLILICKRSFSDWNSGILKIRIDNQLILWFEFTNFNWSALLFQHRASYNVAIL